MADDLTDLVRRLRRGADNYSLLNAYDFLEAADAISRLIELERRVKEAPVGYVFGDVLMERIEETKYGRGWSGPIDVPDSYKGKRVRLLVVEE